MFLSTPILAEGAAPDSAPIARLADAPSSAILVPSADIALVAASDFLTTDTLTTDTLTTDTPSADAVPVVAPVESPSTLTEGVAPSAEEIRPLLIGARAPRPILRDKNDKEYDLGKAYSEKPTVLVFYRGGWCPFCTRQLMEIAPLVPRLEDLGWRILAVGMDQPSKIREMEKELGVRSHELLSDNDLRAAKAFGVAFQVPADLVSRYKTEYGIDLEAASGRSHHVLPVPAVFLIDTEGTIVFTYVNPDYKKRVDGELLLLAAKSAAPRRGE
jgi:peroxiredoxin